MDDLEKERLRYEEIAKVREWETYHPVQNLLYTILATLFAALLFIVPVVLFAYRFVQSLLEIM